MLNENLKYNEDGTVDVEGTLTEFKKLLVQFAEMERKQKEQFASAVEAVLDEAAPDSPIQLPTLASFAATRLGTKMSDYAETVSRIEDFVRNNPKYKVGRGRAGGVRRIEEQPAEAVGQS